MNEPLVAIPEWWLTPGAVVPVTSQNFGHLLRFAGQMISMHKERCKTDPVTRLHNLCDALDEDAKDSPYSQESWDLQEAAYRAKCDELAKAREALQAITDHFAAVMGGPMMRGVVFENGVEGIPTIKAARAALAKRPAEGRLETNKEK